MTSSIVCGIDESAGPEAALRVASALAERMGLRLVVVHAVPIPAAELWLRPVPLAARAGELDLLGREAGDRLLGWAGEAHGLSDAEERLESGSPSECLRAVASEEDAELVVVGSRGTGPLRAAILGSVSASLAREAPCPVVVVPPGVTGAPLEGERIVCGVDTGDDLPAVRTAVRLAGGLGVPLTLTHVLPSGPEAVGLMSVGALPATFDRHLETARRHARQIVEGLLERTVPEADLDEHEIELRGGDPPGRLLEAAASARAALLVVGTRRLGPLRGGLLGSVSRELVRRATRPVVICHHEEPT
jgi:nucleotide-binding universal stress UspA family protein